MQTMPPAMNALPALFTDQTFQDAYQANRTTEKAKTEAARKRLGLAGAGIDLATGELPVVGDLSGLAGDTHMYLDDPSSRTLKNYGLTLLGALPLIPSAASKLKHAKEALEDGEEAVKAGKEAEQTGDLGKAKAKASDEAAPTKTAEQPKLAFDENDPAAVKAYYERPLQGNEGPDGHVQSKHVGKTVEELQERLDSESWVPASSSFSNYETAQAAIHDAINANDQKIRSWLKKRSGNSKRR